MMVPNGTHNYVTHDTPSGITLPYVFNQTTPLLSVGGLLVGGLETQGNGKGKKPIDPRYPGRSSGMNGLGPKTNLLGFTMDSLSTCTFIDSICRISKFQIYPFGGGKGYKPIDPRNPGLGNQKLYLSGGNTTNSNDSSPVYMFQADDTTLLITNLYGKGQTMNIMFINEDGTVNFPGQELFYDKDKDNIIYNFTEHGDSLLAGNSGEVVDNTNILWGSTKLYGEKGYYPCYYTDNVLTFLGDEKFLVGKAQTPVINVEWTDDAVTFTASSEDEGVEIHMWVDNGVDHFDVPNPYVVARTEADQTLTLFAIADAHLIGKNNSEIFQSEYVIPISVLRGDVNNNRQVTISDVTALINHLLTENLTAGETFNTEAADVNCDGRISINDVTALVNFLLTR